MRYQIIEKVKNEWFFCVSRKETREERVLRLKKDKALRQELRRKDKSFKARQREEQRRFG